MDALLLVARLVLCGVMLAAAFGKFFDLPGSRAAMLGFGLPANLAPAAGLALPVVELLLGVSLLPVATAWWAALGTFLLMLAFIGGISWNLSQGRTPDCHCFGQLHSEPAGPRTIVRNAVLALVALFVVVAGWGDPGVSIGGWFGDRTGFELVMLVLGVVALAAIGLLGWTVTQLMAQNGRILDRLETLETKAGIAPESPAAASPVSGLAVGALAPEFTLPDLSGEPISLTALRAPGRSLVLLFTNPGCEPCQRILAQVPAWQERAGRQADLVVVSRGTAAANEEKAQQHKLSRVLLQDGREVNKAFGVEATPSAVLVRPDGRIGSPVAGGATAVVALVESILPTGNGTGPAPTVSTLKVGDDLPNLSLPTLAGTTFAGLPTGREAILLFWSPSCGYCRRIAPDVLAWEANRPTDAPELLIVSIGDTEAIRAEGFQSTVLVDDGSNVRTRFGSRGTPSALRIDVAGRIASPVAHGSDQVLAMLGGKAVAQHV